MGIYGCMDVLTQQSFFVTKPTPSVYFVVNDLVPFCALIFCTRVLLSSKIWVSSLVSMITFEL